MHSSLKLKKEGLQTRPHPSTSQVLRTGEFQLHDMNTPPGRFSRSEQRSRAPLRHHDPFQSQEGRRRTPQFDAGAAAKCVPQPEAWDKMETKALLEFVLCYWTSDTWPTFTQSSRFCREAADFAEDWWPKFTDR